MGAGGDTLCAKGAVHVIDGALYRGHVDIVGAFAVADAADVAYLVVFHNPQNLQLGLAVESLQQPACHTEGAQLPPTRPGPALPARART